MKTELLHSYSSTSLSALSRSPSSPSFLGRLSPPTKGDLTGSGSGGKENGEKNGSYTTLEDYAVTPEPFVGEEEGCCSSWLKNTFTKKNITKKFPVLSWLPTYNVSKLVSDFIAGLTVGLTLIPQGLAMASVAGLPPQVSGNLCQIVKLCGLKFWNCVRSTDFIPVLLDASSTSCSEVRSPLPSDRQLSWRLLR